MDAEANMESIASRTNCIPRRPQWFDGNDIADMSLSGFRALNSAGVVFLPKLYQDGSRDSLPIAGTTIEIIVGEH